MRLTSYTDFGLRALMRMVSARNRVFSTTEITDEFGILRNHLNKIIQCLSQYGFVQTHRGADGGAMLARPAGEIGLGNLVQLLERDQALVKCFSPDGSCCITLSGWLKGKLHAAEVAFLAELDRSTLADIALPARVAAVADGG
nr:Rrf2 family transcriptional regulator [Pseudosulfitobacter koreense]